MIQRIRLMLLLHRRCRPRQEAQQQRARAQQQRTQQQRVSPRVKRTRGDTDDPHFLHVGG